MRPHCSDCQRNPLHCIVPEYLLEQLATTHPNPQVRETSARTLATTRLMSAQRQDKQELAIQLRPLVRPQLAPSAVAAPIIELYTANNGSSLPGSPLPNPGNDDASREAHSGLLATHKFYGDVFGRNSINDQGLTLKATVHYSEDGSGRYNNAFWTGFPGALMVFGDGDGAMFKRFTISLDVIGHELSHGVTEASGGITYQFQSGAVNEHMSDVFGSLVKQYALNQTAATADWLIGKELMVTAPCLRSMADPHLGLGTQPGNGLPGQPRHMSEFNNLPFGTDRGGVHINSGIPNHAFYQVATLLGGNAWETAGRIWYDVLTAKSDTISSNCTFQELADNTVKYAIRLQNPDGGQNGRAHTAVTLGWKAVGIVVATPSTKPAVEPRPIDPDHPDRPDHPTDEVSALQAKLDAAKVAIQKIKADADAALASL